MWALILAGGDGTRLKCLSQKLVGDERPKQFCNLLGHGSLLTETRSRVSRVIPPEQQLFVVTRCHERWYRQDLRDVPASRIIVQPENRGTGVAISLGILRALQEDLQATVAVLPSDHHYSDDNAFVLALRSAGTVAQTFSDTVVLLGAKATHPEVEYGWIEPGSPVSPHAMGNALRVKRFWEKPTPALAKELLNRGCFWNTFISVGQASAFLDILCMQLPSTILQILRSMERRNLSLINQLVQPIDFSRDVLMPCADRLLTLGDPLSGWLDLGSPERLLAAMSQQGIKPTWLSDLENLAEA